MIIKKDEKTINRVDRIYRYLLTITKYVAIYFLLSMAWSFSVILFIIMLVVLYLAHITVGSVDITKKKSPVTPPDKLTAGLHKIQGKVEATNIIKAPMDGCSCIGYCYDIYDVDDCGEDVLSTDSSQTVFENFILCADGYKFYVDATNIYFTNFSRVTERQINDQKHVQYTLQPNDEVVIVADVIMENDHVKELKSTEESNILMVTMIEDELILSSMDRKPERLLNLGIFLSCIIVALILMMNVELNVEQYVVFTLDLNQVFFGDLVSVINHPISFSFMSNQYINVMIHESLWLISALLIVGSYTIYSMLSKLNKILLRKELVVLNYISVAFALIILMAGIFSLISLLILFIFSTELISIKLIIIWGSVVIIGMINFMFFNIMEKIE